MGRHENEKRLKAGARQRADLARGKCRLPGPARGYDREGASLAPAQCIFIRDQASRPPCASAFLTSDCEIPNCLAIADGLTPALKAARTAFSLPVVNDPRHPRRLPASLRLCIGYCFSCRAGRPSTATLGLGGDSRKQRIDFHIIQPLQCSGQVLRQEMALLRGQAVRSGFALWNSRRPGRRHGRWSRKQVWCCLRRPPGWHAPTMPPVAHRGNSWQG